jgi:hypothetical protein
MIELPEKERCISRQDVSMPPVSVDKLPEGSDVIFAAMFDLNLFHKLSERSRQSEAMSNARSN